MKLVLYRIFGVWHCTPEENYYAPIQNQRKINRLADFTDAQEIIKYYCKWFGSTEKDFIILP